MSSLDPSTVHVEVVLARNRAYVKWVYDHAFLKLLDAEVPSYSKHFYRPDKWWHFNRDCWERVYQLFLSRYLPENITISGDFSDDAPPVVDDEFPLEEDESEQANWDWALNEPPNPNALTMADALAALHLVPWADLEDAKVMYRHLSKQSHPDLGGVHESQVLLNRAMEYVERHA